MVTKKVSEKEVPRRPKRKPSIWFVIVSRTFSVVWGVADIYLWKGVWDGVDCFLADGGKDWNIAVGTLTIGVVTLTLAGNQL